ncbi:MAG: PAS domain-containing protein [Hyphomonadaceae bacterium]
MQQAHANTRVILDAWSRLADGDTETGPSVNAVSELTRQLFVLTEADDSDYPFHRAGSAVEALFGRDLLDHNFLTLWTETDRALCAAGMIAAREGDGPVLIHARGETLDGKVVELEFALAPLAAGPRKIRRYLGICQPLTPVEALGGRPVRRLQALAVIPPARPHAHPMVRLVEPA